MLCICALMDKSGTHIYMYLQGFILMLDLVMYY